MVPSAAAADSQVILNIPATPVTAGESVTLKCEARPEPSSPNATFYRNGTYYRTEPTGYMIISPVALSDEGIYKCEIAGRGESPSSWLLVTGAFVVFLEKHFISPTNFSSTTGCRLCVYLNTLCFCTFLLF